MNYLVHKSIIPNRDQAIACANAIANRTGVIVAVEETNMKMNTRELRKAFWEAHPEADRKKIKDHEGTGTMYCADTRCAFVEYVDQMHREGSISDRVAQGATL